MAYGHTAQEQGNLGIDILNYSLQGYRVKDTEERAEGQLHRSKSTEARAQGHERKDTEGSPEVKQRIRQKQREVSAARMLEAIAEADVVITNPEHFAVALAYDPSSEDPPKVVAKGADLMAERIRERAGEEGVPLFQSPVLARALFFTTEIEAFIPEPLFEAVAQVIAYIFNINSINRSSTMRDRPVPRVPDNMVFDSDGRQSEVYDQ